MQVIRNVSFIHSMEVIQEIFVTIQNLGEVILIFSVSSIYSLFFNRDEP